MDFVAPPVRLGGVAPELALAIGALLILLADSIFGPKRDVLDATPQRTSSWHLPFASSLVLMIAAYFAWDAWGVIADKGPRLHLGDMIAFDSFATFVKMALVVFGLLTVWAGRDALRRDGLEEAEFYALVLFAVSGMMLMASAADLIVMFLGLETFSVALYVLVGFNRRSLLSQEAAMKYFLLGAFSSTFFLLGIALVYGAVGSTNLYGSGASDGILDFVRSTPASEVGLLVLAAGLLIIGLAFKIGAVPFHMWTPDAYQGAPSAVTGFMAAGTKLAAFAALLRLLDVSLLSLSWDWEPLVISIAILTMVVGSILAVVQEDLKRVLAYSSIAHAGFLLTGIIAASDRGVSGSLFYLVTYGATVLGAFAVVSVLAGRDERRARLTDFRGLFFERPVLAGALTLFLLSLAGVPLTSGFIGKLLVFGAAVQSGYPWLAVIGALASAIAAFFYLRVLVVMYMQEPEGASVGDPVQPLTRVVIGATAAATLVFGILWGPLADLAGQATFFFAL
ncbi:MAG TPA: NADH-quinone oxidoreductase subunit N [Actinomycetota bacterium]|nr:NADH-quinone oxidoreductase subunit N [Actinomycetota bacterium]